MIKKLTITAPIVIALVGAATIGASGATVAKHLITGHDIKDHSIGYVDLSKGAVAKIKGKPVKPVVPLHWYGAHVSSLHVSSGNTPDFASPLGDSTAEASSTSFVDVIGPPKATQLIEIAVRLQSPLGAGSTRSISLAINGNLSPACTISGAVEDSCVSDMNVKIPANALLYFNDVITGSDATDGTEAAISWVTAG